MMIIKTVAVLVLIVAVSGGRINHGYNSIGESGWQPSKGLRSGQWDNSGLSRSGWGGSELLRSRNAGASSRSNGLSGDRCNQARSSGWISDNNHNYARNAW